MKVSLRRSAPFSLSTTSAVLAIALIAGSALAAPPAGYYDPANGLSGSALKNALHNIIHSHTVIPYSSSSNVDTADALKVVDEDPNNTNNVLLHYKGSSVTKASFGTTWNREHVWPQSRGADVSPKTSDIHHLFAEDPSLNSSRGNSVFNNVYPNHTNSGYGNYWTGTQFEVRPAQRGDIARAILYMDVRYDGSGGETDMSLNDLIDPPYNQMGVLTTLLAWHASDPPDAAEQLRNDRIYSLYQHNRNPFVDHPEYVSLIFAPVTNGNTLAVASTNRATANVGAGAVDYPVLSLNLTANANEWDLNTVAIANVGTLPDASITAVRLYRDNDNSGTVNAGDTLLDTKTFSGGAATFTCSSPSRITPTTANFLITANLSATAANGQTLQIRVNANGLTSATSGGTDVNPTFSAITSSAATVSGGVSSGDTLNPSFVNRATSTLAPGVVDFPFLSLNLAAATNEWDLASVAVSKSGTLADSAVLSVELYTDTDNNGVVNTGDVLLNTQTLSGGAAMLSPASPLRITTSQVNLLLVATFSGTLPNGATVALQVNANGLTSSASGGSDVNPTFSAFPSSTATVVGGVVDGNTLTVGSVNRAPASALASSADVPMLGIDLTANSGEWDVNTVGITKSGTLADAQITAVRLYADANNSGAVDGGDTLLDTRAFSGAAATFSLGGSLRITTVTTHLLVAVDLSATALNGNTFQITLNANGIVHAASGGADVDPTFSAQSSGVTSVVNNNVGTVKIVKVSTRASDGSATKEFVVLANHSPSAINLNGWELRTRGGGATADLILILAGTIPGYGHFLIGSQAYLGTVEGVTADYTDPGATGIAGGMADTTGRSFGLFNGTGAGATKIDGFSLYGGATNPNGLHDGTPLGTSAGAGSATVSFRRKRPGGTTGLYTDTDNNVNDLETVTESPAPKIVYNSGDITVPVEISAFSID